MDLFSYLLGTKKAKGETSKLQAKEVNIEDEGTTVITPDDGYDGMSSVTVNTHITYYTPLSYIESDGTQYIDSLVAPTSNTKVEVDWQAVSLAQASNPSAGVRMFGVGGIGEGGSANLTTRFAIGINNSFDKVYYGMGKKNIENTLPEGQTLYDRFLSFIDIPNSTCGQNEETYNISDVDFANPNNYTCYIFARRGANDAVEGMGSVKIFDVKFYENNVLTKHFIPCILKETEEVGMWEEVSGTFFGNDGTGDFIAGEEI